jgi:hypothetical protein
MCHKKTFGLPTFRLSGFQIQALLIPGFLLLTSKKNILSRVGVSVRCIVLGAIKHKTVMKKNLTSMTLFLLLIAGCAYAQDEIQTVFKGGGRVTGYGALTNKFTAIRGKYANIAGVYGGVYLNQRLFLGLGGAASTNNIGVPAEYSAIPGADLTYQYGQCGLVTEYVLNSNKVFHVTFSLFSGAGFTLQYDRHDWDDWDDWDDDDDFDDWDRDNAHDENWFTVVEPGVQVEVNVFKWMRFSPGVSYRTAFGSDGKGLSDSDLSDISYNVTLKFGRF